MVEFKPGACVLLATSKLGRFQPTPAGRESTLLQCARACSPPPRLPPLPQGASCQYSIKPGSLPLSKPLPAASEHQAIRLLLLAGQISNLVLFGGYRN